jgi:hypothetical protein
MGKPYSMDLRERVVAAVETGGLSCHQAAAQFGVGASRLSGCGGCVRPAALRRGKWAGTSRRQFRASTVPGCWSAPRRGSSPCAGLSPNSPSAG